MRALCIVSVMTVAACAPPPGGGEDGGGGGPDSGTPGTDSGNGTPWDAGATLNTAAAKYPDMPTLWTVSMVRTCGPNNGVCHHSLQFPDMQTQSGLLATINTRCNQIRQEPSQIDNLCEPAGDALQIGSFSTVIGSVIPVSGADGGVASLTVTLKDPIAGAGGAMAIVRQVPGLANITLSIPSNGVLSAAQGAKSVSLDYATLNSKTKTPAPGGTVATFLDPPLWTPGNEDQVILGDPNGDGIFGATLGGALVKPGQPMASYLFLRLLSPIKIGPGQTLTNVAASPTNEAQMPIANLQYWDLDNSMVALWCWISGLKADGTNAVDPIDYAHCDVSQMPAPVSQSGEATTWTAIYSNVIQSQCLSCHHVGSPYASSTTLYMDDPQHTYDVLLGITGSGPSENQLGLPYVTRSTPSQSYLYLKVTGATGIQGAQMPLGGQLSSADVNAIAEWISQGANNN